MMDSSGSGDPHKKERKRLKKRVKRWKNYAYRLAMVLLHLGSIIAAIYVYDNFLRH